MLGELTRYLSLHQRASLSQLALAMRSNPSAVEAMLARLVLKGRVRRLEAQSGCDSSGSSSSCCKCDPADTTVYEWLESPSS